MRDSRIERESERVFDSVFKHHLIILWYGAQSTRMVVRAPSVVYTTMCLQMLRRPAMYDGRLLINRAGRA